MSVSIKLSRTGAKNSPFYRIIAATTRSKRDGKNLEILGSYNPNTKKVEVNSDQFDAWVKKGAIVTQGVKKIFAK
jgi:small subunit ribosomal protein S16